MTVETFTGSHQQNKCILFPVEWTQFYLEKKGMHAISFFHHLYRGGSLVDFLARKDTKIFFFFFFFCLGRYLHVLNSHSLCPYMFQTDYSLISQVATVSLRFTRAFECIICKQLKEARKLVIYWGVANVYPRPSSKLFPQL